MPRETFRSTQLALFHGRGRLVRSFAGTTLFAATLTAGLVACEERLPRPYAVVEDDAAAGAANTGEADDAGDASTPASAIAWSPCYQGAECGTLRVPVDDARPDGETIDLALLRVPANSPAERLGVLLVNRGGPGKPMVDELGPNLLKYVLAFAGAFRRFDVVVFDWRGTGKSQGISAVTDDFMEGMRKLPFGSSAPGDVASVDAARTAFVDGFRSHASPALLGHLGSVASAHDVERLRVALGEERISFLGMSHGARLATTYAALYPERTNAFVLDAPVAPSAEFSAAIAARVGFVNVAFDRFFERCSMDASCKFHGGAPKEEIAAAFDALRADIVSRASGLPAGDRALSVFEADSAFFAELADGNVATFASDLAAAESGDGVALLARADTLFGRSPSGTYDGSLASAIAISCHETPFAAGTTVASYRAFVDALEGPRRSVEVAAVPWAWCVAWPWTAPSFDPFGPTHKTPMLVVSSAFDPAAGVAAGKDVAQKLGSESRFLLYEGGGHVASVHSACVRKAITGFLTDPAAPTPERCAAE